jgi:hypothetical protein
MNNKPTRETRRDYGMVIKGGIRDIRFFSVTMSQAAKKFHKRAGNNRHRVVN